MGAIDLIVFIVGEEHNNKRPLPDSSEKVIVLFVVEQLLSRTYKAISPPLASLHVLGLTLFFFCTHNNPTDAD